MHSTLALLASKGYLNVDEFRRGIELLPAQVQHGSSYYGKWARSMASVLIERQTLGHKELEHYVFPQSNGKIQNSHLEAMSLTVYNRKKLPPGVSC